MRHSMNRLTRYYWIRKEQEALRHVATLVARGAPPPRVFTAVVREVGTLLNADHAAISRYESDTMMCLIAHWCNPSVPKIEAPFGGRWDIGPDSAGAVIRRTGKPTRYACGEVTSEVGAWFKSYGINHIVACPVVVDGQLWGTMMLMFVGVRPPPGWTEERMQEFVELVGCTIAQAQSRADLIASRARVVQASDEARRRIERDLHDSVQQRIISLGLDLRAAESSVPRTLGDLRRQISEAAEGLASLQTRVQEIARGIHPAVLTRGGLTPALRALTRCFPMPSELHVEPVRRLPEPIELGVYYIASEALANVLKHAEASTVRIDLAAQDGSLRLQIRDDGVGGADLRHGTGLIGIRDRVESLSGTLEMTSPIGEGTSLLVMIPV